MSWALFQVGIGALALALNGLFPRRWWPIRAVSFLAQVFAAELALWLGLWVGAVALWLALRTDALDAWPGMVGAAAAALSVAVWGWNLKLAWGARRSVSSMLSEAGLPEAADVSRWRRAMLPRWWNGDGVECIRDIRYAEGGGRRRLLDVWKPNGAPLDKLGVNGGPPARPDPEPRRRVEGRANSGAPVLLQIHGGAWFMGSKRTQGRPILTRMARAGWVCVAINYRLSPRVRFPQHLIDCKLALKWIREHIAEYGGDPSRVLVSGGSAGGHLATLMAVTANDPRFQPGFESTDTSVLGAASIYGPFDIDAVLEHTGPKLRVWAKKLIFDGQTQLASPIHHVKPGLPPMLVVQGTADNLVPAPLAHVFVSRMREAGNQVTHLEVLRAPHAFDVFFSLRSEAVGAGVQRFFEKVASSALP
jgi:acetyl esterase/lipase